MMRLATVLAGRFKGSIVHIDHESDGICLCDLGEDKGGIVERIENLQAWISVDSVEIGKGKK